MYCKVSKKDLILSTTIKVTLFYTITIFYYLSFSLLVSESWIVHIFLHYFDCWQMQTLDDAVRYYRNTCRMLAPAHDQLLLRYASVSQRLVCWISEFVYSYWLPKLLWTITGPCDSFQQIWFLNGIFTIFIFISLQFEFLKKSTTSFPCAHLGGRST